MDLAARRPHLSAGIALASAAVIAAGPMTQHLPKLDVAQHLPKVSVTDINLTDASESMMDLFAGVENQLASLASGPSAAAVPAAVVVVNPLQTWIDDFTTAGSGLQTVFNIWENDPFPIAQQVLANWAQYGIDYITPYKSAAKGAVTYFGSTKPSTFWGLLSQSWTLYQQGNIASALSTLDRALGISLLSSVGLPLEKTLTWLPDIPQNLTSLTNQLVGTVPIGQSNTLTFLGTLALGFAPRQALDQTFQNISDAYNAGNLPAMLTNMADVPGVIAGSILNGQNGSYGIFSPHTGVLNVLFNQVPASLAKVIVAPGAQNLSTGGSLAVAGQNLLSALQTGWPDFTPVVNTVSSELTAFLQNIPSVLSNLPTLLSGALGSLASHIGLLITNLLKLL
ncbi:hypothetical protein H7K38_14285 [Mycobacterium alsense]|uniref:PE-PGRS family protein n=1 Tax=Mycobacterium alsense TaxID=324058 RepID=A0AA41XR41_9MYCO|nr:hypothetical protein [Mycobacterium alsense]MCV7379819.1 hypothetical protein [Mycobacterium alsense]